MKKLSALLLLLVLALVHVVQAADVILSWPANAASDQVKNYYVYQATGSGAFSKVVTNGVATTVTLTGIAPGAYRFYITAANAWGVESTPSSQIGTPPASPGQVAQVQAWLVVSPGTTNKLDLANP
jgi:hypothetical protein